MTTSEDNLPPSLAPAPEPDLDTNVDSNPSSVNDETVAPMDENRTMNRLFRLLKLIRILQILLQRRLTVSKRMHRRRPQKRHLQRTQVINQFLFLNQRHRVTRMGVALQMVAWHQGHTWLGLKAEVPAVGPRVNLRQTHRLGWREIIFWNRTLR